MQQRRCAGYVTLAALPRRGGGRACVTRRRHVTRAAVTKRGHVTGVAMDAWRRDLVAGFGCIRLAAVANSELVR